MKKRLLTLLLSACIMFESVYVPAYAAENTSIGRISQESPADETIAQDEEVESEAVSDSDVSGEYDSDTGAEDSSESTTEEDAQESEEDAKETSDETDTESVQPIIEEESSLLYASADGLLYSVTDEGVVITGYDDSVPEILEIPSEIEDKSVISIASKAFLNCNKVKEVVIPDTVTQIGYMAFANCTALSSVTLPQNAPDTPEGQNGYRGEIFSGCTSLTSVTIPKNWDRIDGYMFNGSKITALDLSECTKLATISRFAFYECEDLETVVLPDSLTGIGYRAFAYCDALNNVTLPSNSPEMLIESLDYRGNIFEGCTSLTSVTIPKDWDKIDGGMFEKSEITTLDLSECTKLTTISQGAFYRCEKLETVVFPESLTGIGFQAFAYCEALNNVTLPQNSPEMIVEEYGYQGKIFEGCTSLTSVTIPNDWDKIDDRMFEGSKITAIDLSECTKMTTIGQCAFYQCKDLVTVVLPESLTGIGYHAFSYCNALNNVTLPPNSPEMILGEYDYHGCIFEGSASLTTVTIPKDWETIGDKMFLGSRITALDLSECTKLTTIEQNAFYGCADLKTLIISDSVTGIGYKAFARCTGLENVTLPKNAPEMLKATYDYQGRIFEGCSSLTTIEIPQDWERIDDYMFGECGITVLDLSACTKLTTIGHYAFTGCSALETLILSDSITGIGYRAFENCKSLNSVTLPENAPEMIKAAYDYQGRVFYGCSSLTTIEIPQNWETINEWMFSGSGLTVLDLSENEKLKTIGHYAFYYCENLTTLIFSDSITGIGYQAFASCPVLENIKLPKNPPEMLKAEYNNYGDVFYNCPALTRIAIPKDWEKISEKLFQNNALTSLDLSACSKLVTIADNVFARLGSDTTVYIQRKSPLILQFLLKGCTVVYAGEYTDPDPVLTSDGNAFTMDKDRVTTGMIFNYLVSYSCMPEKFSQITDPEVVVFIPSGAISDIYLDGIRLETSGYSFDEHYGLLRIHVTNPQGTIRIPQISSGNGIISSVSQLEYKLDNTSKHQVIDSLSVKLPSLSLECAKEISTSALYVRGITESLGSVNLYCDGEFVGNVKANKLGDYSTTITLPHEGTFRIKAECEDNPEITSSCTVTYDQTGMELTKFMFYYHQHSDSWLTCDLLEASGKVLLTINPNYEVLFKIAFSDPSEIENVYVLSNKNGNVKSIKAKKTEDGEYVANGFFDPRDHGYVPGQLSVQYSLADSSTEEISIDNTDIGEETIRQTGADLIKEATGSVFDFNNVTVTDRETETRTLDSGEQVTVTSGNIDFGDGIVVHTEVVPRTISGDEAREFERRLSDDTYGYHYAGTVGSGASHTGNSYRSYYRYNLEDDYIEFVNVYMRDGMLYIDTVIAYFSWIDAFAGYAGIDTGLGVLTNTLSIIEAILQMRYGNYDEGVKLLTTTLLSIYGGLLLECVGTVLFPEILPVVLLLYNLYTSGFGDFLLQCLLDFIMDPSGYVYEAVEENRLEDVKATIYFKTGPGDTEFELWNSEDYGQSNPLFTNLFGEYAWDVPEGLWKVRYEKEGYNAAETEWMEVPPVRTEVNVGLVSTMAPQIENIYTDGSVVTVMFSQYMDMSDMTAISVKEGDKEYSFTVKEDGLSKTATLILDEKADEGSEFLTVSVPSTVKNYAGTSPDSSYQTDIAIKKLPAIKVQPEKNIGFEESVTLEATIQNYENGIELELINSDSVGLDAAVTSISEAGVVTLSLTGNLPGNYTLTLAIKNTEISAVINVNVCNMGEDPEPDPEYHVHQLSPVDAIAPTCIETGRKAHYKCSTCEALFADAEGTISVTEEELIIPASSDNHIDEDGDGRCDRCGSYAYKNGLWIEKIEDRTYTGKAIKPEVNVFDNTERLTQGKDYTVSFSNNTNAGDATVKIKGKGNYESTETTTFRITQADISGDDFTCEDIAIKAGNKLQKPRPVLKWNGKQVASSAYSYRYYKADGEGNAAGEALRGVKDPGKYVIILESNKGNFCGERQIKLEVAGEQKLAGRFTIAKIKDLPYTGEAVSPEVVVSYRGTKLTENTDYTLSFKNNEKVGTATVVVTGMGDYVGQKTATFKITGTSIAKATVEGIPKSVVYTGNKIEFDDLKVYLKASNDKAQVNLEKDTDYEVNYSSNLSAGKATITINGIGGYTGTVKKTFTITRYEYAEGEGNRISAEVEPTATYHKGGAKPQVTVRFTAQDGTEITLSEKSDYTLSYRNNMSVAVSGNRIPTAVVTLKGSYKGTISRNFEITPGLIDEVNSYVSDKAYSKKAGSYHSAVTLTDTDGKKLASGKDYEIVSYTLDDGTVLNKKSVVDEGHSVTVLIRAKDGGNYAGTTECTYRVTKASISSLKATAKNKTYTGQPIELEPEDITVKATALQVLVYGEDYEIVPGSYVNNLSKGTASVTIRGIGNYGGTRKVNFKIKARLFSWWWR